LHITDRLSQRGGADWHLLGVLDSLQQSCELLLAVGRDDGSATAPCSTEMISGLDAPDRQPVGAKLDELAGSFSPDIIHMHNCMNPEALEWAASASGRLRVATVQDHRSFCPGRGKLTLAGLVCTNAMSPDVCAECFTDDDYAQRITSVTTERLAALQRFDRLIVLSHYMKRELAAVGVTPERITVIPPFVHGLDANAPLSGPPCVLFAGRLVQAKGVDDALAAWRMSEIDLPLVFAGSGTERQRLEDTGCEVLGWIAHEEMSAVYRRARVVLMPSRWQEPFGIVGLEALSLGVPVVAWNSGGIADWYPGTLPAWGDLAALAGALRAAIGQPAQLPAGFSRQSAMDQLLSTYRTEGARNR